MPEERPDLENQTASSTAPRETFECPMCRQQAPIRQSIMMGGRRLCFGCAGGWFEDED
jgi:hypothetical protein